MSGTPALLGALGLVALGFALVSFVLLLLGYPTDLGWVWGNFGVGLALLVLGAVLNFDALRERMSSGEARTVRARVRRRTRTDYLIPRPRAGA